MTTPKRQKPAKDNLVVLSHARNQRLLRAERSRRADALFAAADPQAAVRALPPDEFFYVLHDLGFPEAMDILQLGTPEQVQTVLDFSLWDRDRISLEKADDWLGVLVEAEPEVLGPWAQGIDVELLALLVRQRARIYDLSQEEVPEESTGALWNTPDGCFTIDLQGQPEQTRVTQRLLDGIYRYSPGLMRRLLVGMRAESDAEMEETAFRWRAARMADLGFADPQEAMAAYQELDPASVTIPAAEASAPAAPGGDSALGRMPGELLHRLASKTPFARAVAGLLDSGGAREVHDALVLLANRVLSAERISPGEDDAVRDALESLAATLDLAVEFLARGNPDREVAAVRGVPLLTLHRLGVSLTGKVRRLAAALLYKNPYAKLRPAIDIFEDEDADVLVSLSKRRPRFPRLLDAPPAAGDRPFATLADLATATRAVERAAAALQLVAGLGVRPAHLSPEALTALAARAGHAVTPATIDPATIDTGSLARTVLVARLLGHPPEVPLVLDAESVRRFKDSFNSGQQLPSEAGQKAMAILSECIGSRAVEGAHREVALRWLSGLCPLDPVIQAGPTTPP